MMMNHSGFSCVPSQFIHMVDSPNQYGTMNRARARTQPRLPLP